VQDFCFAYIREIHEAYSCGKLSVRSLVLSFLSRIASVDKGENGLNSVLEINPDALFIADKLDELLESGGEMGPLFGIPVLLKDNINTGDRLHTSAGSLSLADNYAPYDSDLAVLIRKAGAVILGKANMTEFANWMSRDGMPSGYSSRGGQVINPYNREMTPSGSSSGSAVAVAAGLCTVSVGTETSGSIISPAVHNGIVGLKPSLGLVSRNGIIPIASTFDTAGPMARSVEDAALLLNVISDSEIVPAEFDPAALTGLRIGINRSRENKEEDFPDEYKAAFDRLLGLLGKAGAVLIDNTDMDHVDYMGKALRYEFKACINYYLSTLHGSTKMTSLKDIVVFNQANAEAALKYGQSVLLDAENNTSGTLTEPEYLEAIFKREKSIAELEKIFSVNRIDILLCENPTNLAPLTGFPALTIPIGKRKDNLPIGSYWMARHFEEGTLFRAAYAAEKLLGLSLRPEL